jgi:hypothetical protein
MARIDSLDRRGGVIRNANRQPAHQSTLPTGTGVYKQTGDATGEEPRENEVCDPLTPPPKRYGLEPEEEEDLPSGEAIAELPMIDEDLIDEPPEVPTARPKPHPLKRGRGRPRRPAPITAAAVVAFCVSLCLCNGNPTPLPPLRCTSEGATFALFGAVLTVFLTGFCLCLSFWRRLAENTLFLGRIIRRIWTPGTRNPPPEPTSQTVVVDDQLLVDGTPLSAPPWPC